MSQKNKSNPKLSNAKKGTNPWSTQTQKQKPPSSEEESSDDEGNKEMSDKLMQKLLQHYKETDSGQGGDTQGLGLNLNKIQERLTESIRNSKRSDAQICLICLEAVGRQEPIWSCAACYEIYHLVCVQQWSSQALQLCELREEKEIVWCCPKCRKDYSNADRPRFYKCFCGKVTDPPSDPWNAPHSCGEKCGKPLDCEHKCLLLCHPGPCPDCPKVIHSKCYCGKRPAIPRRCGQKGWSCAAVCGRTLNCGVHQCQELCHQGECTKCESKSRRRCRCGKKTEEKPCIEGKWSCEQVCGKKVQPCGKHTCPLVCHEGECSLCVQTGENSCPCGKHIYTESGCIDNLPCCGDTCGKLLDCGIHECFQRCHRGDCPPCTQTRAKRCRCGLKEKSVQCNKEYLCETKCKKKRQCGRHPCSRKCCDGTGCPPCEVSCGRTLNCGRHKCASPCHSGMCYPCPEIVAVTCRCGKTQIRVPCGRAKKTRPPRCRHLCEIPPDCHHPSRTSHRCHFDACPPCKQRCDKAHPSGCAHKCPVPCHSAVWMDTNQSVEKPATPWEKLKPVMKFVDLTCPPCRAMVTVTCKGHHETTEFPCCEVREYSCGRPCGRPLACGNHHCKLDCHKVPKDRQTRGKDCEECESMCDLPRPEGCPHNCPKACHPAPCPPCRQMIRQKCHCALNPKFVPCTEWTAIPKAKRTDLLSCGNQCPKEMSCGHRCTLLCHLGPCSTPAECKKKVAAHCKCGGRSIKVQCKNLKTETVDCDEECARKAEEKQEAEKLNKMRKSTEAEEEKIRLENLRLGREDGPRRIRKKKDRNRSDDENGSFMAKNRNFLVIGAVAVLVIGIIVTILNNLM